MLLDMTSSQQETSKKLRHSNSMFQGLNLLSSEENNILRSECDDLNFEIKAAGVAQLYCSAPSVSNGKHDHWIFQKTGIICFIKDNSAHGFFIRLFDMENHRFCWEQELFLEMKYETRMPYFHIFEADTCMAGLNFANESEASSFNKAIKLKMDLRRARVEEKKRLMNTKQSSSGRAESSIHAYDTNMNQHSSISDRENQISRLTKSFKKEKRKKLTKIDIGKPTNFIHVKHVGMGRANGAQNNIEITNLDINDLDEKLYERAGIPIELLKDPSVERQVRKVITQQVQKNELSNDTLNALTRRQPPPPPARVDSKPAASLPSSSGRNQIPTRKLPPVPMQNEGRMPAPAKPDRMVPGLPPSSPNAQVAEVVQPVRLPQPLAPPICEGSQPLPPPPPPPPIPSMVIESSSKLDSKTKNSSDNNVGQDALLNQIRAGKALKRTEQVQPTTTEGVGRNALLEQIRAGANLKPVSSRSPRPEVPSNEEKVEKEVDILSAALAKAMADRSRAVQSDDSDNTDSDGVDVDEWDD